MNGGASSSLPTPGDRAHTVKLSGNNKELTIFIKHKLSLQNNQTKEINYD